MKKQEAFNPMNCDEEEIEKDRDYKIMELHLCHATRYDGGTVHIINAFCPHCFIEINERSDFIGFKTRDGHRLSVNKKSMSFTCPAHGGWITTVKREPKGENLTNKCARKEHLCEHRDEIYGKKGVV